MTKDGPIECSYESPDGSRHTEMVADLTAWIKVRFQELIDVARSSGKESKINVYIDGGKYRFAELSASPSKFTARYYHPAYVQHRGFMTYPTVTESDDIDEISADVVRKASTVKFR